MSQETKIDSLSGGISDEDAKLVDSILNDLGPATQSQMTPEQQAQMQQQQMQQQQMQQQQMQQQAQMNQGPHMVDTVEGSTISDSIKKEAKSIMVIIFLCIAFNIGQVDGIFKKIGMFVEEGGSLNLQCVFVKALMIASLYFVIKSQLL